jgi:hypothetical protein
MQRPLRDLVEAVYGRAPMADDHYSEDEAALILRRAAELQPGRTMSLAELEAVADEAGIERSLVRQAAMELRQPQPPAVPHGVGRLRVVHERMLPARLPADAREHMLAEIRRHLPDPGKLEEHAGELIWSARGRRLRVIVTGRGEQTLVRVEENLGGLVGGLYGGIVGGSALGGLGWIIPVCIAALHMPILIPVFFAVWVYASYLVARTIFTNVQNERHAQLQALAEGLSDRLRD